MDALRVAVDGGIYLSPGLRQFFHGTSVGADPRVASLLTPREREVVDLLADGLEYKQIAERLNISPNTVNNHLAHVRESSAFTARSRPSTSCIRGRAEIS